MNLSPLLTALQEHRGLQEALQDLHVSPQGALVLPVPRSARIPLAASISAQRSQPLLILVTRNDRQLTYLDELPAWNPEINAVPFPEPNALFYELESWGPAKIVQRASVLAKLLGGSSGEVIVATTRAAMTRTVSSESFKKASFGLVKGDSFDLSRLVAKLVDLGYEPSTLVTDRGQISRRGGIVDLWPPACTTPIRVDFFGDEIDGLRTFDASTQRSLESVRAIEVTPAREGFPAALGELPFEERGPSTPLEWFIPQFEMEEVGLVDYLPAEALILHDDFELMKNRITEIEVAALRSAQEADHRASPPYVGLDAIVDSIAGRKSLDMGALSAQIQSNQDLVTAFSYGRRFGGQVRELLGFLNSRRFLHEITVVVSRQAPRLAELWAEEHSNRPVFDDLPSTLEAGEVYFVQGALSEGWSFRSERSEALNLLTDAEIFGWSRPQPRARLRRPAPAPEFRYADLSAGDLVVHVDHGIGRFDGLVEKSLDEMRREFLQVTYADGARVFVPIHQADRLTRYVGADGSLPTLSRLGTQEWERSRSKAREAVEEIAKELLELYAKRSQVQGFAFSPDSPWQSELEASFPYLETSDQIRALEEAKMDMESSRPMDRLICGDVGYGKTEVALRLAFKAVMDGKQVALLVPTTVLAQQHFNTFGQRLAPFPVEIEMLSRFRSRSEAQDIVKRLNRGDIDVVIGTHRLLQKDVEFKDLGLLIIDEEQRFGVTHKEALKRMRTEVDVLTMTATPIPRTLYMALAGIRDISTINTPPQERVPVTTHVGAYDPQLIRQAILRELERGGQVFFVHNRVHTIESVHRRVRRLVPEARMAIAHGQMHEDTLAKVMERFYAGELDVLLSTSIIESGLDVPNANTLIVDRAELFGLSQLYQLRGRVGRGTARGFSYFFHTPGHRHTEEARERLEILAEHSDLGAGYSIAMRDLEMRGAGDVLGRKQHGHIAAIGFHYYSRLLGAAVRKFRTDLPKTDLSTLREHVPVAIDLALPASIPPEFIRDRDLRLQLYRRMADLRSLEEVQAVEEELEDRFGDLPQEVINLIYQLRIKVMAHEAGVESISTENGQVLIQFEVEERTIALGELAQVARASRRGLWLTKATNPSWQEHLRAILEKLA